MATTYDFLSPDGTEVEEQRIISAPVATPGDVLTVNADLTVSPAPGGGSQTYAEVKLRTSLDFPDPRATVPVLVLGAVMENSSTTLTLPPSPFGNDGVVSVRAYNDGPDTYAVKGSLIVVSADGTKWIEQDAGPQTVPAADTLDVDFANAGGGAGVGLSWNAVSKQVDIASSGVYSAFAVLFVQPTA